MRPTRSQVGDAALAAALTLIGIFGTIGAGFADTGAREVGAPAIALAAGTSMIIVVRRRWPFITLGIAAVLTSTYLLLSYPYGPIFFPFVVAVYTAARYRPPHRSAPVTAGALVILLLHLPTNGAELSGFLPGLAWGSSWVVVPYAIGAVVRLNREAVERQRTETIREHVYDERLRVAQEVHDVVGHGLAAIKMQADVALHVLAKRPEQAETALRAISRTSTDALGELRSTLAVVRRTDDEEATREPVPGLDRLDALRERMGEAGLDIRIDKRGTPAELPASVDLAAYRIVQESLTNVLRHGASNVAQVEIGYETDAVVITISNPNPNDPTAAAGERAGGGNGLGIPGMRQRVTALGGEFSAGPMDDGGFLVRATLPIGRRS